MRAQRTGITMERVVILNKKARGGPNEEVTFEQRSERGKISSEDLRVGLLRQLETFGMIQNSKVLEWLKQKKVK